MASSNHRIRIHANPEAVFKALSTEEGLKGWYTSKIEGTVSQGQTATFHFPKNETFRWKFTEITPSQITWECVDGPGVAKGTTATFRLSKDGESDTVVRCDHEGWPEGHEALATCNTLWGILMAHLRDHAESAKSAPAFKAHDKKGVN